MFTFNGNPILFRIRIHLSLHPLIHRIHHPFVKVLLNPIILRDLLYVNTRVHYDDKYKYTLLYNAISFTTYSINRIWLLSNCNYNYKKNYERAVSLNDFIQYGFCEFKVFNE